MDSEDSRSALTEADTAAQKAIIGALRAEWGEQLNIVGEEDDDLLSSVGDMVFDPLRRDIFDDDIPSETPEIEFSDCIIFVDPLDGTREFVEGRLENCQVLVGIAIDGEAVAGAVGIPFPDGDLSTDPTIVYGIADFGSGVIGSTLKRGPYPLEKYIDGVNFPRPHHATGDSTAGIMEACKKSTIKQFGGSNVVYGGAGNKILAVALGEVASSMSHKVGGAWDLCAPEAILKSMGGKMTDLFGDEISIYRKDASSRCNEWGFLATSPGSERFHENWSKTIKTLPDVLKYETEVKENV